MVARHRRYLPVAALLIAALSSTTRRSRSTGSRRSRKTRRAAHRDQMAIDEKNGGSRPLADDASFFLERELRRRGYDKASVEWRSMRTSNQITLLVDEGKSQTLGEITSAATSPRCTVRISEPSSAGQPKTAVGSGLLGGGAGLAYVEVRRRQRARRHRPTISLARLLECEVAPLGDSAHLDGDRNDIHVQIDAGPLHHLRGFELTGDTGTRLQSYGRRSRHSSASHSRPTTSTPRAPRLRIFTPSAATTASRSPPHRNTMGMRSRWYSRSLRASRSTSATSRSRATRRSKKRSS